VIVDLSGVEFAASIAIGQLIVNAQAVKSRGGHMVLIASGNSIVMMSLTTTGIDKVIPVFQYATDAYVGALRGF
jgi:anti-anti-sigma factor